MTKTDSWDSLSGFSGSKSGKKKQKSASIPASRLLFHKPNLNFTLSFSRKCNYNVNLNITYYLDETSNTLFSIITLCKWILLFTFVVDSWSNPLFIITRCVPENEQTDYFSWLSATYHFHVKNREWGKRGMSGEKIHKKMRIPFQITSIFPKKQFCFTPNSGFLYCFRFIPSHTREHGYPKRKHKS